MIEIYIKPTCPFCINAIQLLTEKNVPFKTYNISTQPELRDTMISRAQGRSTVPQIFINEQHIGGCDDLFALERQDRLEAILLKNNK